MKRFFCMAFLSVTCLIGFTLAEAENACPHDLDRNNEVNAGDRGFVFPYIGCEVGAGSSACDARDLNGDGVVSQLDVDAILSFLGPCDRPQLPECPWDQNRDNYVNPGDRGFISANAGCNVNTDGSPCLFADLDLDRRVTMDDREVVSRYYGPCPGADPCPYDQDLNGIVNEVDAAIVASAIDCRVQVDGRWCDRADVNGDKQVDQSDHALVLNGFLECEDRTPPPDPTPEPYEPPTVEPIPVPSLAPRPCARLERLVNRLNERMGRVNSVLVRIEENALRQVSRLEQKMARLYQRADEAGKQSDVKPGKRSSRLLKRVDILQSSVIPRLESKLEVIQSRTELRIERGRASISQLHERATDLVEQMPTQCTFQ